MRILKIPYNAGGLLKKQGVEKGPDAICTHLNNFYLKEDGLLPVLDLIDVEVDNKNIENSRKIMKNQVTDTPFIALGGDHSITRPLIQAMNETGLIVFDAHADLMQGENTHEDWLRSLIEDKELDPKQVILVGLRNMHAQELNFIRKHKLNHYSMKEISMQGIREACDSIMSVARQWPKLHVSVDIDVLDPAFAPGTGYREPGGLSTRELLYFLQRLKALRNPRTSDIVEVNPEKDIECLTSLAAAKCLVEMA